MEERERERGSNASTVNEQTLIFSRHSTHRHLSRNDHNEATPGEGGTSGERIDNGIVQLPVIIARLANEGRVKRR